MLRQPSEWKSPLTNSAGYLCTMADCHCSSSIFRVCLRPGPCCGNRHVQCLDVLLTKVQPCWWTQKTSMQASQQTSLSAPPSEVLARRRSRQSTERTPRVVLGRRIHHRDRGPGDRRTLTRPNLFHGTVGTAFCVRSKRAGRAHVGDRCASSGLGDRYVADAGIFLVENANSRQATSHIHRRSRYMSVFSLMPPTFSLCIEWCPGWDSNPHLTSFGERRLCRLAYRGPAGGKVCAGETNLPDHGSLGG